MNRTVLMLGMCFHIQFAHATCQYDSCISSLSDARAMCYSGKVDDAVKFCSSIKNWTPELFAIAWTVQKFATQPSAKSKIIGGMCSACNGDDSLFGYTLLKSQLDADGNLKSGYDIDMVTDGIRMMTDEARSKISPVVQDQLNMDGVSVLFHDQ